MSASRLAADLKVSCQPAGRRHFLSDMSHFGPFFISSAYMLYTSHRKCLVLEKRTTRYGQKTGNTPNFRLALGLKIMNAFQDSVSKWFNIFNKYLIGFFSGMPYQTTDAKA